MEIKPYVNSLFRYTFIGLMVISFWGCSTSRISIDVLRMPETQFKDPVKNIVLLNRVGIQYANTKQYVNGRVIAQYNGITDMMVNESINQIVLELNANNFVIAFDTSFTFVPKNGKFDGGYSPSTLLSKLVVSKICSKTEADVVVTVDGYDAEVDSDSDVQYSTPVDRNYGTVRIPYFTGDQSVLMQMLFRAYSCKANTIIDETSLATQVSISASGSTPYDVNSNLADANNILIQASHNLGTDYAKQVIPTWKAQSRTIYITGNDQLKEAYKFAKSGNWPAATDIWYLVATSNNEKVAKRASFNLILASEISGNLELAEEWARRCVNKYQMKEAESYLATILLRKKEIEKLQSVYPMMRE